MTTRTTTRSGRGSRSKAAAAPIVGVGEVCGRYLDGLPLRPCEGLSFEYRTSSHRAGSCRQWQAIRKCGTCGASSSVDVSADVPRVITTAEAWAKWWATVDARR